MGISNFPPALQPIIQQGFLDREFEQALVSRLGYRACADREDIPVGIGETLTKTRAGLKPSVTTPVIASANTNLDNGLSPSGWGVEQYTIAINHYAATTDLNMVTSRVGIASQFLQNAAVNGEQAARSLDELARNALFAAYFGGNTRVTIALAAASPTVSVDDIRGFAAVFNNGVQVPVGASNGLVATIGSNAYVVIGAAADSVNVSHTPGGISGVLTLQSNVSAADGAAGNTVQAANASNIVRELMVWMPPLSGIVRCVSGAAVARTGRSQCQTFMSWRSTSPNEAFRSAPRIRVGRFYSTGRYRARS